LKPIVLGEDAGLCAVVVLLFHLSPCLNCVLRTCLVVHRHPFLPLNSFTCRCCSIILSWLCCNSQCWPCILPN
jgi:hypothetical protein